MIAKKLFSVSASLAAIGMVGAPLPLMAQASPAIGGGLDLPATINMLGSGDPNVRTATAVVNGSVITGTDVDHRLALTIDAAQSEVPEAEVQRLRGQILRNLIDETLKIQAAATEEMAVTAPEVEQRYAELARERFQQDQSGLDQFLLSIGSSPASLKRQIQGEIAWSRLLRRNISPFVNVSEEEVREMMARLEASRGTEEYRLGEIYLSSTPETEEAVLENIARIMEQLRGGGSFVAYARQFSEASTAVVGGDLGFVRLSTLPSEIATVAREMQPGQLVGPVAIPGGYSILYLIDKKQVLTADPRDAVLSLKQISISFPSDVSEPEAARMVEEFNLAMQSIRGCGDASRAAGQVGATIVDNNEIQARQLPEQLQATILGLQVGQTTPPFGSIADGVRVLQLCGRDDPQGDTGPGFEELLNQLESERINKRAQRYLRDLRNDAYIEYN
ncbi:MAG: peptidylprolyl isomerase [Alteripontixanthobacter sp.]